MVMNKLEVAKDVDIKEYLNAYINYLNNFLDDTSLFAHCYAYISVKYNVIICKIQFKDVKPKGVVVFNDEQNLLTKSEMTKIIKEWRFTEQIVLSDNSYAFMRSKTWNLWDKTTAENEANDLIVKILRREI